MLCRPRPAPCDESFFLLFFQLLIQKHGRRILVLDVHDLLFADALGGQMRTTVSLLLLDAPVAEESNVVVELPDFVRLGIDSQIGLPVYVHFERVHGREKNLLPGIELPKVSRVAFCAKILEQQRHLDVLLDDLVNGCLLAKGVDDVLLLIETENAEVPQIVTQLANSHVFRPVHRL